jgi:hypothetical protein
MGANKSKEMQLTRAIALQRRRNYPAAAAVEPGTAIRISRYPPDVYWFLS